MKFLLNILWQRKSVRYGLFILILAIATILGMRIYQYQTDPRTAVMLDTTLDADAKAQETKRPSVVPPVLKTVKSVNGELVYQQTCLVCHSTGAAGAPKLGNKAAWSTRIAKNKEELDGNALRGFNTMSPKGGYGGLSDEAAKAAVDYMLGSLTS